MTDQNPLGETTEALPLADTVTTGPMRITLCGSTKFRAEYELWNMRLTLAGFLVYSVSGFGHSGDVFDDEQKRRLDQVHLAKIDASHAIVVIDVGGYIGDSTAREIAHAKATGKDVYYVSGDPTVYRLRVGPDGFGSQRDRAFGYVAASPPSRALSQDEREAVERVRGDLETLCDCGINATIIRTVSLDRAPGQYARYVGDLGRDLRTLLNILQPEGEANG